MRAVDELRGPVKGQDRPLRGARIFIVEDEILIALELQSVFEQAGAELVGPVHTLENAMKHASKDAISAAVLDIRLGGDSVRPVARILAERGIPFVFYSGQQVADALRMEWPDALILQKPVVERDLVEAVCRLLR
jgi:DNA-binding NarL/FixJ family response regulator